MAEPEAVAKEIKVMRARLKTNGRINMTNQGPLTKRKPNRIFVRLLGALVLAAVAFPPRISQARAGDAGAQCPRSVATLNGAYMSIGGGTIVGTGPITFIGTVYFDGKGGVVNPFTGSLNGEIIRADSSQNTGTYTVNSDCSGTQTLGGSHFDIRVSPDGSRVDYIDTDPPEVVSGTASRVKD